MIIALISSHSPGCTEPSGGRPPGVPAVEKVIERPSERHSEKQRRKMVMIEDLAGEKVYGHFLRIFIVYSS
jgi:hypothetical protein